MKRQNLQNQQHKLEMEEQELIEKEKATRERAFNVALLHVQSEKEAREKKETKNKKDLKDLDSSFKSSVKALNDDLRAFQDSQKLEADARHNEFDKQKKQLYEQQKAELEGKGVDVNLLEDYRKALEIIRQR